jgi:conjugal transfer pilus assembly protein TraE
MKMSQYKGSFKDAIKKANIMQYSNILLAVATLIAIFKLVNVDERIVLVPPQLDKRATISMESADEEYKRSWALFTSTLMGNVSPETVDKTVEHLSLVFHPKLFAQVKPELLENANKMRLEGISISFKPRSEQFEPSTGKIFVSGVQTISKPKLNDRNERDAEKNMTYEFFIKIRNGKPEVNHYDFYEGNAHTQAWIVRNGATAE